ncbi:MAG: YCF48-related protein [Ignavibacteriales bacterium]|nr:YCF48-related protein [Ignavibacteriales bacterium]
MKIVLSFLIITILFFSCTSQQETVKQKEDKPIVAEKKGELFFSFEMQKSKTNSSLRGISVIDSLTAWACGSNGIFLRTTDGGNTWTDGKVKGFEALDFRDVEAFNKNTAILMSTDAPAFFFKTTDGGKSWKRKYMNRDPKVFFDGMAFWNEKNGIALSDPIDGKFFLVVTKDGGDNWEQYPSLFIPSPQNGEAAFAASGTSITVAGKDLVWFGTGGGEQARIFLSEDNGENWRAFDSQIKSGSSSSGVFSICFKDELNGIAVGGDYKNDKDNIANISITDDGGLSWQSVKSNQPNGFRSCVSWNEKYKFYLTTGTSGTDYSIDNGKTWKAIDSRSFNSIGISKSDGSCFMVGDKGVIAKIKIK